MATDQDAAKPTEAKKPITIKKYANRRLYNTETSSYVTLEYLSQMVKDGSEFVVIDAKTGEDITRSVLTQIIFEEESKGQNLLPINFLRQLISYYGDSLQSVVPQYLDNSMALFTHNQEKMREYFQGAFGNNPALRPFEELAKQNAAIIERTLRMFTPFGIEVETVKKPAETAELDTLKSQLEAMQRQLNELSKK